ncbi:hypothetical protein Tco_0565287 [Tanacetum coccineum]
MDSEEKKGNDEGKRKQKDSQGKGKLHCEEQPSKKLKLRAETIDALRNYLRIRKHNHFRAFDTLWEILHVLDRQDLYHLHRVVQDYYEHISPTGLGLMLLDCVQDTAQRKKFKRLKASTAFKTRQTDTEQRRPTIKKLEVKQVEFKLGEDCWEIQVNRSKNIDPTFWHFAKECRSVKRVKDYEYHKEKMLLRKKEVACIQLSVKHSEWLQYTYDEPDKQDLEAHYMFTTNIQEGITAMPELPQKWSCIDGEKIRTLFEASKDHAADSFLPNHIFGLEAGMDSEKERCNIAQDWFELHNLAFQFSSHQTLLLQKQTIRMEVQERKNKSYWMILQDFKCKKRKLLRKLKLSGRILNKKLRTGHSGRVLNVLVSTASPNEGLSISNTTNFQEDNFEIPPLEDIHEDTTDGIFTHSSLMMMRVQYCFEASLTLQIGNCCDMY